MIHSEIENPNVLRSLGSVGEAVVKPVIATFTRAAPDDHLVAVPNRSLIRARRRGIGGGDRGPTIMPRLKFRARPDRIAIRVRTTPDKEFFPGPYDRRTKPRRRSVRPTDGPPGARLGIVKRSAGQRTKMIINPAPDKEIHAIPGRSEEQPG